MLDALSRLNIFESESKKQRTKLTEQTYNIKMNEELSYQVVALQIGEIWLQKLKQSYALDPQPSKLIDQIVENNAQGDNAANLPFKFNNGILYAKNDAFHTRDRPVVATALESDFFSYAHDQLGHGGYERTHERIAANFYIFNISKKLRSYLHHCHQCRVLSTPRHQPYGTLQPILTPPGQRHNGGIVLYLICF